MVWTLGIPLNSSTHMSTIVAIWVLMTTRGLMDLADPLASLFPGARGAILSVLARTTTPLTSPTVATLTPGRYSRAGTLRAINELVAAGVVTAVPAGKAKLYSLNRDHVAASAIEQLASLRTSLFDRIRGQVTRWQVPAASIAVFGSTARGEAHADSDVDLLVVRRGPVSADDPIWIQQLMEIASDITAWSGNRCDVLEYSETDLVKLIASGEPLLANIRDDALTLYGSNARALLKGARH